MNAVIIYDDFACAAKAKVMLERAAHRADVASLWTVRPWRLDMLMPSLSADAALTDAAEAHLVVLVLRHSLSLPAWVPDWLDRWAKRREVLDAALAVWDGGNGDTLSAYVAPELSRLAGRHGLTFIFRDAGPDEDESATSAAIPQEREVIATRRCCHPGAGAAPPILGGAMNEQAAHRCNIEGLRIRF